MPDARYIARLMQWVARKNADGIVQSSDGRTLRLDTALVDDLIVTWRQREADLPLEERLETRGRALLMAQLMPAKPQNALLAQFWTLKQASHLLVLDPGEGLRRMKSLLGGAATKELQRVAQRELVRGAKAPGMSAGVRDELSMISDRDGRWFSLTDMGWAERAALLLLPLVAGWAGYAAAEKWAEAARIEIHIAPAIYALEVETETIDDGSGFVLEMVELKVKGQPLSVANQREETEVTLDYDYAVSVTEITRAQYLTVMGSLPEQPISEGVPTEKMNEIPVVNVTLPQVVQFMNRLSELSGLEACYSFTKESIDFSGYDCGGYRLARSAELYFAGTAGRNQRYAGTDDFSEFELYGNLDQGNLKPVKSFRPNQFGIYDLSGNASEMIWALEASPWSRDDTFAEAKFLFSNSLVDNVVKAIWMAGHYESRTPTERNMALTFRDAFTASAGIPNFPDVESMQNDPFWRGYDTIGFRPVRTVDPSTEN